MPASKIFAIVSILTFTVLMVACGTQPEDLDRSDSTSPGRAGTTTPASPSGQGESAGQTTPGAPGRTPILSRTRTVRPTGTVILEPSPVAPSGSTAFPEGMPGLVSGFKSVSVGFGYTCAIADDDSLDCWGANQHGLDTPPTGAYIQVSAGNAAICTHAVHNTSISSRCGPSQHACAVDSNSNVTCWGNLSFGQGQVPEGKYISVSAGGAHSCGLRTDSTVACWGYNAQGQTNAPTGSFKSVSAGGAHSCAIRDDGTIECWGGDAATSSSSVACEIDAQGIAICGYEASVGTTEVPGHVESPAGSFSAVGTGSSYNCALKSDGSMHCWGNVPEGLNISPTDRFVSIDVGGLTTCTLTEDETLQCWGFSDHISNRNIPNGRFASISSGNSHSCGITSDGRLYCWGDNSFGEVVRFEGRHKAVAAGTAMSCSIREDETLGCWHNYYRQSTALQEEIVTPDGAFSQVKTDHYWACGLKDDGSIHCWTRNILRSPPITLEGAYMAITPANRLCGARIQGGVTCWDWSGDWEQPTVVAEDVRDMTGKYTALSFGQEHICGILEDGRVECSGSEQGIFGEGKTTPPEGRFISISAAWNHTCGVRESGELECWGENPFLRNLLPNLPDSGNLKQIVTTDSHACWLSSEGSVECRGGTANSPLAKPFESISFIGSLGCGVLRDGRILCWSI